MTILIFGFILAGGAIIFFTMRSSSGSAVVAINNRLGRYGLVGDPDRIAEIAVAAGRNRRKMVASSVEKAVDKGGFTRPIAERLDRADLKMVPAEFVSIAFGVFVLSCLIGLVVKGFFGLFILGLAGGAAPWVYLHRRMTKRKRAFVEQLADMAQMMGNSMLAGFSIMQSMELVANEGPAPASHEFERVVTEVKLGLPLDAALEHLLQRQPSEDLELMVVAINVQRQIGGNLSEILAIISQTIRERVRFERDLRTLTAQARYSSYIITALPVAVAIIINLMDQPYESFLYTTTLGYIMLGIAICMLGLGFFFLSRIANIEV